MTDFKTPENVLDGLTTISAVQEIMRKALDTPELGEWVMRLRDEVQLHLPPFIAGDVLDGLVAEYVWDRVKADLAWARLKADLEEAREYHEAPEGKTARM